MQREPIQRRAKTEKKEPTDYAMLIEPSFQPAVGARKRKEEAEKEAAKKEADEAAKPKRKLTKKQRTGKPTYAKMIAQALIELQERGGSSAAAITKHVEANHGTNLPDNFKVFLRRALKKAVEDEILRHEGARYRLSSSGKYKLGLKKRSKRKSTSSSSSSSKKTKKRKSASSRSKSPKRATDKSKKKKKSSSSSSSSSKKSRSRSSSTSSSSSEPSTPKKDKTSRSSRSESRSSSSSSSSSKKATTTPAGYSHAWEFQEGSRWMPYDATGSDVVEKAYLDYKKNPGMCDVRAVKSGEWQYQVDFLNNKQTNIQHANHTVRNIRRVAFGA